MKFIILSFLFVSFAFGKDNFLDSVERLKWDIGDNTELSVVWIKDDTFPKFTASVYFQDGAISDDVPGISQTMFDQLTAGTDKANQRQLAEFFDFYGANLSHSVTHEYSVFTVQALTKDIEPVFGKVCEIFNNASFPSNELNSHLSRAKSRLRNLVASHSNLADRVFRRISLEGTPYAAPVEGTIESLSKITPQMLKSRLNEINKTKKVLYLAGPSDVKDLKQIISKQCGWKSIGHLKHVEVAKPQSQTAIYLVDVPKANQAQIRIGRYMAAREFEGQYDHFYFLSGFLGGGFTSKLVQELRVKRGLTYSAGAYVSMLRDYGRAGIITFSKNETAAEAISVVRDALQEVSSKKVQEKEFLHQKGHQIGSFAFSFEQTNALLGQIMLYDHQNRDLKELVNFPEKIARMTLGELAVANMEAFPWARLTIVVVGDKSLAKSLSRIRPVRVVNFEDYL